MINSRLANRSFDIRFKRDYAERIRTYLTRDDIANGDATYIYATFPYAVLNRITGYMTFDVKVNDTWQTIYGLNEFEEFTNSIDKVTISNQLIDPTIEDEKKSDDRDYVDTTKSSGTVVDTGVNPDVKVVPMKSTENEANVEKDTTETPSVDVHHEEVSAVINTTAPVVEKASAILQPENVQTTTPVQTITNNNNGNKYYTLNNKNWNNNNHNHH